MTTEDQTARIKELTDLLVVCEQTLNRWAKEPYNHQVGPQEQLADIIADTLKRGDNSDV